MPFCISSPINSISPPALTKRPRNKAPTLQHSRPTGQTPIIVRTLFEHPTTAILRMIWTISTLLLWICSFIYSTTGSSLAIPLRNDMKVLQTAVDAAHTSNELAKRSKPLSKPSYWIFTNDTKTGQTIIRPAILHWALASLQSNETIAHYLSDYAEATDSIKEWTKLIEQGIAPCEKVQDHMKHPDKAMKPQQRADFVDCAKAAYALREIIQPGLDTDFWMLNVSLVGLNRTLEMERQSIANATGLAEKGIEQGWAGWVWGEVTRYSGLGKRKVVLEGLVYFQANAAEKLERNLGAQAGAQVIPSRTKEDPTVDGVPDRDESWGRLFSGIKRLFVR